MLHEKVGNMACRTEVVIRWLKVDFKTLSVKTGIPSLWVSQNLPANEATGHPPTVECKQTKKSVGPRNAYIADSTVWSSCFRGNKFEYGS